MSCLVVSWSAVWGLIKVDSLDFTWRLSPRRRCPRRMCPRRMTPRRMTPRRMSPRRKAETDIHETGGTDRWRRRMALGGKACTEGSLRFHGFSSQGHPSVPLVLALPVSETDGAETDVPETEEGHPRRMSPRRRKAARDGCPRDGGRPPETDVPETEEGRPRRMSARRRKAAQTDVAEMDVPETEGVCIFKHHVRFEWMWLIPSSFFSWVYGSSDIECLLNDRQCCVYVVCAVWWPSGSGADKYGSSRFSNESSFAFM